MKTSQLKVDNLEEKGKKEQESKNLENTKIERGVNWEDR